MKTLAIILLLFSAGCSGAQSVATSLSARVSVLQWHERDRATHKNNPDVLVLPGLVANRAKRLVNVYAEATGIQAGNPVEFFLVGEKSGHDYESIAISFATPGDIHRALEFIGMTAGDPVNPARLRFHPRGERVLVTFRTAGKEGPGAATRAERLVVDGTTKQPLPETGFVFVGSVRVDENFRPGGDRYLADIQDPHAIASNYNEPATVLDVPRSAAQGSFYRDLTANPEFLFEKGTALEVRIVPEYPPTRKRVVDLTLEIGTREDGPADGLEGLLFCLRSSSPDVKPIEGLNPVLARFISLGENGHDVFVTLRFGKEVTLGAVTAAARLLSQIDSDTGIHVGPPETGDLYYRAFRPDELFRDRNRRVAQPWELTLSVDGGSVSGVLTHIREIWNDQK
ncbi:MAG: hypothetical protein HQ559_12435, partial [Lentisphaerae bacterium]|nr:hypothetical protein [Lentisphaerota bacterium]